MPRSGIPGDNHSDPFWSDGQVGSASKRRRVGKRSAKPDGSAYNPESDGHESDGSAYSPESDGYGSDGSAYSPESDGQESDDSDRNLSRSSNRRSTRDSSRKPRSSSRRSATATGGVSADHGWISGDVGAAAAAPDQPADEVAADLVANQMINLLVEHSRTRKEEEEEKRVGHARDTKLVRKRGKENDTLSELLNEFSLEDLKRRASAVINTLDENNLKALIDQVQYLIAQKKEKLTRLPGKINRDIRDIKDAEKLKGKKGNNKLGSALEKIKITKRELKITAKIQIINEILIEKLNEPEESKASNHKEITNLIKALSELESLTEQDLQDPEVKEISKKALAQNPDEKEKITKELEKSSIRIKELSNNGGVGVGEASAADFAGGAAVSSASSSSIEKVNEYYRTSVGGEECLQYLGLGSRFSSMLTENKIAKTPALERAKVRIVELGLGRGDDEIHTKDEGAVAVVKLMREISVALTEPCNKPSEMFKKMKPAIEKCNQTLSRLKQGKLDVKYKKMRELGEKNDVTTLVKSLTSEISKYIKSHDSKFNEEDVPGLLGDFLILSQVKASYAANTEKAATARAATARAAAGKKRGSRKSLADQAIEILESRFPSADKHPSSRGTYGGVASAGGVFAPQPARGRRDRVEVRRGLPVGSTSTPRSTGHRAGIGVGFSTGTSLEERRTRRATQERGGVQAGNGTGTGRGAPPQQRSGQWGVPPQQGSGQMRVPGQRRRDVPEQSSSMPPAMPPTMMSTDPLGGASAGETPVASAAAVSPTLSTALLGLDEITDDIFNEVRSGFSAQNSARGGVAEDGQGPPPLPSSDFALPRGRGVAAGQQPPPPLNPFAAGEQGPPPLPNPAPPRRRGVSAGQQPPSLLNPFAPPPRGRGVAAAQHLQPPVPSPFAPPRAGVVAAQQPQSSDPFAPPRGRVAAAQHSRPSDPFAPPRARVAADARHPGGGFFIGGAPAQHSQPSDPFAPRGIGPGMPHPPASRLQTNSASRPNFSTPRASTPNLQAQFQQRQAGEIVGLRKIVNQYVNQNKSLEDENKSLTSNCDQLSKKLSDWEAKFDALKGMTISLQKQVSQLEGENKGLRDSGERLRGQIDTHKEPLKARKKPPSSNEVEIVEAPPGGAAAAQPQGGTQDEDSAQTIADLQAQLARANREIGHLQGENDNLKGELAQSAVTNKALCTRIGEIEAKLDGRISSHRIRALDSGQLPRPVPQQPPAPSTSALQPHSSLPPIPMGRDGAWDREL